jgi:WXG100 family type VII secretion target
MAMAGNIRVSPEQLQSIAGQLNSGASNIESINSQLQSQVAPLGSDWAGVAQARFHELWAEWQRSSRGGHAQYIWPMPLAPAGHPG